MATAGEKVAWLRGTRRPKTSQAALAKLLGTSRNVIANVENGRTALEEDLASRIAKQFGHSLEWLFDERELPHESVRFIDSVGGATPSFPPGMPTTREAHPGVGRRLYPVLGVAGAAAFPLESQEATEEDFIEFAEDLYRPGRFAIRILGDSNDPRIKHGTFGLIQPSPEPPPGLFVAAKNEHSEYVVKVLQMENGDAILKPFNSHFPILRPGEGWQMVGYLVGLKEVRGSRKYIEEGDNDGIRP